MFTNQFKLIYTLKLIIKIEITLRKLTKLIDVFLLGTRECACVPVCDINTGMAAK